MYGPTEECKKKITLIAKKQMQSCIRPIVNKIIKFYPMALMEFATYKLITYHLIGFIRAHEKISLFVGQGLSCLPSILLSHAYSRLESFTYSPFICYL